MNKSVTTYIRSNPEGCDFMLRITAGAMKGKYYNPKFSSKIDKELTNQVIGDIIEISKDETNDDSKLIKKYGKNFYNFLHFVLLEPELKVQKSTYIQFENSGENQFDDVQVFEIKYEENTIEEDEGVYLFHGSASERWYSILMNGLQVMSGTEHMANGAAYGKGIYLSSSSNLSSGYCRGLKTYHYGYIIGVFQCSKGAHFSHKSNSIYVTTTPEHIKLRYIVSISSFLKFNSISDLCRMIDNKFVQKLVGIKKNQKQLTSSIASKRLMKEIKSIPKVNEENKISLSYDEEDIYMWNCVIPIESINDDSELYNDMKKYKIKNIRLQLRFPSTYPINPPFVRIITPRLKFQTGHVTSGGSICMEILTHSKEGGWSPSISVETLVVVIKSLLIEGNGRIDDTQLNKKYNLKEAEEAFKRMVISHGWK